MLPPLLMLATKNRFGHGLFFFLAFFVPLVGCAPPGSRALLDGKRLLDRGDCVAAIERFRLAISTPLLKTNAQAWNYLGLACHRAGRPADAEQAYQKALALNHDLVEAHFNLGSLWLEQNKLEPAKGQLTTYTQLRGNSVEGWLALGAAQLRARELVAAEKSFREALRVSPQNSEAFNGLGLIQVQRNRARDAAQFFAAALKQSPGCRPALLNLAVVSQQYLNDRAFALQKYREYLALTPRPANWETVNALAQSLEQQLPPPPRPAQTNVITQAAANTSASPSPITGATRVASPPQPEPATNLAKAATVVTAAAPAKVVVVKLPPEPVVKTGQDFVTPTATAPVAPKETASASPAPLVSAEPPKPPKRGFFDRLNPVNLFRREPKAPPLTPLPPSTAALSPDTAPKVSGSSPAAPNVAPGTAPPAPAPNIVAATPRQQDLRYKYLSPAVPPAGNRPEAERAFAQGTQSQRAGRLTEAVPAFRQATQLDPGYFEAQYCLGLAAFETRDLRQALTAGEYALAVRPDSVDARYNFALVLKAANYPLDAAAELEKILAANPGETRAHLTLGNLYAQPLHDAAKARIHYLKVLELDPRHPQATSIRYWLVANPS